MRVGCVRDVVAFLHASSSAPDSHLYFKLFTGGSSHSISHRPSRLRST